MPWLRLGQGICRVANYVSVRFYVGPAVRCGYRRMTVTQASTTVRKRSQGPPPKVIHPQIDRTATSTAIASTHAAAGGTEKLFMPATLTPKRPALVDGFACHRVQAVERPGQAE